MIEPSMCGGVAALREITFTACYYYGTDAQSINNINSSGGAKNWPVGSNAIKKMLLLYYYRNFKKTFTDFQNSFTDTLSSKYETKIERP